MVYFEPISEATRTKILACYDRTAADELAAIASIKQWFAKQPHLPECPPDPIIATFLRLNKFSVEKAKQKLDNLYTLRDKFSHIYDHVGPSPEMLAYADYVYIVPLPRLTDNFKRVTLCRVNSPDADLFEPYKAFAWSLTVCEMRTLYDYENGDIFITDLGNGGWGHMTKTTPMLLKQTSMIVERTYTARVMEWHFINCPPFVDRFLVLFKAVLKEKIANRLYVHGCVEDLYRYVPKRVLPSDYGGEEKDLNTINNEMKAAILDLKPRFDALKEMHVDESKRVEPINDEFMNGIQGNFKKLEFD